MTQKSSAKRPCSTALLLALLFLAPAAAADGPALLFSADSELAVEITAPLSDIMQDRDDPAYREGTFRFIDWQGEVQEFDVKIRTRGNFRRRRNICEFAPLRLNFAKKQLRDSIFDGQDKLKLVTHCDNGRRNYEQNILKEYLAYRIFNTVTDLSFRVRLLHVTYVDTNRGNKSLTRYAFLIEDRKHIAQRTAMPLTSVKSIDVDNVEPVQTSLVTVFQYLIGNTDFSAVLGAADETCCHNIVLFNGTANQYVPLPYDFDLAGIVNTPYAAPNPKHGIDEVTDRLYLGLCQHTPLLEGSLERFRNIEPEVRRLIDKQVELKKAERYRMQRYVDKFYADIATEELVQGNLVRSCN